MEYLEVGFDRFGSWATAKNVGSRFFAVAASILKSGWGEHRTVLRLIGQLGLTGEISPVKHPAKRRRMRTVLQEVMYRAAQFIAKARKLILDFGALAAHMAPVFVHVQNRLLAARSPRATAGD